MPLLRLSIAVVCLLNSLARAQCDFQFSDQFGANRVNGAALRFIAEPSSAGGRITMRGSFVIPATTTTPSVSSNLIRWDGQSFSEFFPGLSFTNADLAYVETSSVTSPGYYSVVTTSTTFSLRRWTGSSWLTLASGVSGTGPRIFAVRQSGFDELYVASSTSGGAPTVRRWDGTTFQTIGSALPPSPFAIGILDLVAFDDGTGEKLVLSILGQTPRILESGVWQPLGNFTGFLPTANDLEVVTTGTTSELWAGGSFTVATGSHLARWTGTDWLAVGSPDAAVDQVESFAGANGTEIFIAGTFQTVDGQPIVGSARWDGSSWSALSGKRVGSTDRFVPRLDAMGNSVLDVVERNGASTLVGRWNGSAIEFDDGLGVNGTVYSMLRYDDGNGEKLWIGGSLTDAGGVLLGGLATFDGARIEAPGGATFGPNPSAAVIGALKAYDPGTGSKLYAAGTFHGVSTTAGTFNSIASWNGTSWQPLGSGLTMNSNQPGTVNAMAVFDAGAGSELYVAGLFDKAGGTNAENIAAWNGSSWRSIGSGVNGTVNALAVYGGQLYVGGGITGAGVVAASGIVATNGTSFIGVGPGLTGSPSFINALHVHTDQSGERLYAGGYFTGINGLVTTSIAAFDGTSWMPLGSGVTDVNFPVVASFATFDEGDGPALCVGGFFASIGGISAGRVAKWKDGAWSALDSGIGLTGVPIPSTTSASIWAISSYADARGGDALFVGGNFNVAGALLAYSLASWGADPQSNACAVLGPAAESAVGASAGGPFDLLRINGRTGNGHRVNVAMNQSITIDLLQPPTVPYSTGLVIYGFLGVPTELDVVTIPFDIGDLSFPPCPFDPADPRLFVVADDFGFGCAPLLGAGGTPWTLSLPAGLGFPTDITFQAIVGDLSATYGIAKTNAVLMSVR